MNDNVLIPFKLLIKTIQLFERINMDDYSEVDRFDYDNIFSLLSILKTYHGKLCDEYEMILYLDNKPYLLTGKQQQQLSCPIWEVF